MLGSLELSVKIIFVLRLGTDHPSSYHGTDENTHLLSFVNLERQEDISLLWGKHPPLITRAKRSLEILVCRGPAAILPH